MTQPLSPGVLHGGVWWRHLFLDECKRGFSAEGRLICPTTNEATKELSRHLCTSSYCSFSRVARASTARSLSVVKRTPACVGEVYSDARQMGHPLAYLFRAHKLKFTNLTHRRSEFSTSREHGYARHPGVTQQINSGRAEPRDV